MSQRKKTDIKNGVETPRYEYDDKVKMLWEKEVLGMYLSAHPMEKYGFKNIEEYEDGKVALQGGEIAEVYAFHPQKNPAKPKMAWVTINTLFGNVKVVVFAREYARTDVQDIFQKGNIVLVKGTRQGREILYNSGEVLEHAN